MDKRNFFKLFAGGMIAGPIAVLMAGCKNAKADEVKRANVHLKFERVLEFHNLRHRMKRTVLATNAPIGSPGFDKMVAYYLRKNPDWQYMGFEVVKSLDGPWTTFYVVEEREKIST